MSLLNAETAFSQTEQVNHEGHESPSEFKGIVADITESLNGMQVDSNLLDVALISLLLVRWHLKYIINALIAY